MFLALVLQPGKVLANENSVQVQTKVETDGWEEEYTDTDSRRGTLSIRCETFQGFHGRIKLHIRNMVGGWERSATLTEKGGYAVNLSLPVGAYEIERCEAQTDGRKFRCQADRTEVEIKDEKIIMCRVTITPDSVFICHTRMTLWKLHRARWLQLLHVPIVVDERGAKCQNHQMKK